VPGVCGPHEQASQEIQNGNYAIAYYVWRPLAETGDPEACYNLGWMYHNGYGLTINDQEAEKFWQKAAARKHAEAMFSLGNLYSLGGQGVPRDYTRAIYYWTKAAELGHKDARSALLQLASNEDPGVDALFAELLARNAPLFDTTGTINADSVYLRGGPGTEHKIIKILHRQKPVVELLRQGSWVKVGIAEPPYMGWVYGELIRATH